MKTKINLILTFITLMVSMVAFSQQTISGSVTDENGVPLPGATVFVQGTSNATTTDFDGNFSINASNGDILEASYVGYNGFLTNCIVIYRKFHTFSINSFR